MNNKDIFNQFKINVAINNFKEEYKNEHTLKEKIKRERYSMKKKIIIGVCTCCFALVSGVAIANYSNIISTFGLGKGVDTAAKNGYVEVTEMNPISDNAIIIDEEKETIVLDNIKVDTSIEDFLMDDINISTHFYLEIDKTINDMIDLENLQNIELSDLLVTDEENRILFCMDENTFNNFCQENKLDYKFMEFNENYYNCGLNNILTSCNREGGIKFTYNMYSGGESFPKSKKLNFRFTKIYLEGNENNVTLNGKWNIKLDVPENMYNRKSISYKVVNCENPDFQVTNATLTDTGFELGIIVSNMAYPEEPQVLKDLYEKVIRKEITIEEYNEKVNTEKELIEARRQDNRKRNPIPVFDFDNPESIENVIYIENEYGEKFTSTMSPSRRQDSNFIEENKFSFYDTFSLTAYDATDKLKVRVMFKEKPYIIELEKVEN